MEIKFFTGNKLRNSITFFFLLFAVSAFGYGANYASAQTTPNIVYVPLIGITSVPKPLTLPAGPGDVTYNYSVKNFLKESALTNVQVSDDKCSPVRFVQGDDNNDTRLDYNETWRYACTSKLTETTQSIATVTANGVDMTAKHNAYATVVVGSNITPPLVSIVNVTKVANPLLLPAEGSITYTYKVNNPGEVALNQVSVTDDKCGTLSGKLGDTNGNNLLDIDEVWIYTCTATITQTSANTAAVRAFANGLMAADSTTLIVNTALSPANLFDVAIGPVAAGPLDLKIPVWIILSSILAALVILFVLTRSGKRGKTQERPSKVVVGKP